MIFFFVFLYLGKSFRELGDDIGFSYISLYEIVLIIGEKLGFCVQGGCLFFTTMI